MTNTAATDVDSFHHSHRSPTIVSHGANERSVTVHVWADESEMRVAINGRVMNALDEKRDAVGGGEGESEPALAGERSSSRSSSMTWTDGQMKSKRGDG